jgi:hypothetical protein
MYAFGGLGHDDFARGFGAPHIFCEQLIDADILKTTNTWCRARRNAVHTGFIVTT